MAAIRCAQAPSVMNVFEFLFHKSVLSAQAGWFLSENGFGKVSQNLIHTRMQPH